MIWPPNPRLPILMSSFMNGFDYKQTYYVCYAQKTRHSQHVVHKFRFDWIHCQKIYCKVLEVTKVLRQNVRLQQQNA